ncbi:MAG: universal stress protein [Bacteroidetes bacterium]|jgi:nucleotide-binding universal stress UspA family protein|nr:universal stress protein [Bacteroidota bacterium]
MFSIDAILHSTDFSTGARQALAYAIAMARRHQSSLHVLHVTDDRDGDTDRAPDASNEQDARYDAADEAPSTQVEARMAELIEEAGAADLAVTLVHERGAVPVPFIIDYAEEQAMDLVVMGTHGCRGIKRMLLGSVEEAVVHEAECSVMTVRGDMMRRRTLQSIAYSCPWTCPSFRRRSTALH